ncbi:MAG: YraN family protein [Candidatus Lariskella arthropodorum]
MSIDKKKASSSYLYGLTSEVLVAEYLVANSYAVLENRYRTPYGELDLIATKKGTAKLYKV